MNLIIPEIIFLYTKSKFYENNKNFFVFKNIF